MTAVPPTPLNPKLKHRPIVVSGCLICRDCREPLIGWRTDFTGRWQGEHLCPR